MPLGYNAGDTSIVSVTIAQAAQLSSVAALGSKRVVGIVMPAAWTAATLTLYCTINGAGTDSLPVNDGSGGTKTLTVAASQITEVPPDFGYAFPNIQLYSSVAQGAARVIKLICREI